MRIPKALATVVVSFFLLPSCARKPADAPPELVSKYGFGAYQDRHITLQPDVVILPDGPTAIRAMSSDGFTWRINGNAKGARQLSVGKVMLLTSRAVGRVAVIRPAGSDLDVTVVPVNITDVIRDGTIDVKTSITPESMEYHNEVGSSQVAQSAFSEAGSGDVVPTIWRPQISRPKLRRASDTFKETLKVKVGSFEVEPYFKHKGVAGSTDDAIERSYKPGDAQSADVQHATTQKGKDGQPDQHKPESRQSELGVKIQYTRSSSQKYDKNMKVSQGLKFGADVRLSGERMQIRSHLAIAGGQMSGSPTLVLDGIDRLAIGLLGGAENGARDNVKARIEVPIEIAENVPPTMTYGVPMAIHIKFKFIVETAFSGNNSTLWTKGVYKVIGGLGVENGKPVSPTLEVVEPLLGMQGITVGASGLVTAVEFRFLLGLGTDVAMSGFYGKVIISAGVSQGSVLGIPIVNCKGYTFKVDAGAGLGIIVDTKFLAPLDSLTGGKWKKSEVELWEKLQSVVDEKKTVPDVPICKAGL